MKKWQKIDHKLEKPFAKTRSFLWKIENRPTYGDFENKNYTPPTSGNLFTVFYLYNNLIYDIPYNILKFHPDWKHKICLTQHSFNSQLVKEARTHIGWCPPASPTLFLRRELALTRLPRFSPQGFPKRRSLKKAWAYTASTFAASRPILVRKMRFMRFARHLKNIKKNASQHRKKLKVLHEN